MILNIDDDDDFIVAVLLLLLLVFIHNPLSVFLPSVTISRPASKPSPPGIWDARGRMQDQGCGLSAGKTFILSLK